MSLKTLNVNLENKIREVINTINNNKLIDLSTVLGSNVYDFTLVKKELINPQLYTFGKIEDYTENIPEDIIEKVDTSLAMLKETNGVIFNLSGVKFRLDFERSDTYNSKPGFYYDDLIEMRNDKGVKYTDVFSWLPYKRLNGVLITILAPTEDMLSKVKRKSIPIPDPALFLLGYNKTDNNKKTYWLINIGAWDNDKVNILK